MKDLKEKLKCNKLIWINQNFQNKKQFKIPKVQLIYIMNLNTHLY